MFADGTVIVFSGDVAGLLEDGAVSVRLDNAHLLTARPAASGPPPSLGQRVEVRMLPEETQGWRLTPPALTRRAA